MGIKWIFLLMALTHGCKCAVQSEVTIGSYDQFTWSGDCKVFNAVYYGYLDKHYCRCAVVRMFYGRQYTKYGFLITSQHGILSCFYSDRGLGTNIHRRYYPNGPVVMASYNSYGYYLSTSTDASTAWTLSKRYYNVTIDTVYQYTFDARKPLVRVASPFQVVAKSYSTTLNQYQFKWLEEPNLHVGKLFQVNIKREYNYSATPSLYSYMMIVKVPGTNTYTIDDGLTSTTVLPTTLPPTTVTLPPTTVTLPPTTVTLPPTTVTVPPTTVTLPPTTVTLPPTTQLSSKNIGSLKNENCSEDIYKTLFFALTALCAVLIIVIFIMAYVCVRKKRSRSSSNNNVRMSEVNNPQPVKTLTTKRALPEVPKQVPQQGNYECLDNNQAINPNFQENYYLPISSSNYEVSPNGNVYVTQYDT